MLDLFRYLFCETLKQVQGDDRVRGLLRDLIPKSRHADLNTINLN
ncbi:hypothetical protein SAMN04488023_101183 [Pedobacter rhizosphaerae]|uniref:Uncharacterized protein n=1 Tax=Pedobacter rhizosphaerae TaxID=390241 RepID=A0A1H9J0K4_9SPHI|nr:hypothetical protein SAMN04488023_101183 [Pedobacter rhizosphaerae]